MLFETLKTGFVENKGRSGPLSVDSKTQGKVGSKKKWTSTEQASNKTVSKLVYCCPRPLKRLA